MYINEWVHHKAAMWWHMCIRYRMLAKNYEEPVLERKSRQIEINACNIVRTMYGYAHPTSHFFSLSIYHNFSSAVLSTLGFSPRHQLPTRKKIRATFTPQHLWCRWSAAKWSYLVNNGHATNFSRVWTKYYSTPIFVSVCHKYSDATFDDGGSIHCNGSSSSRSMCGVQNVVYVWSNRNCY